MHGLVEFFTEKASRGILILFESGLPEKRENNNDQFINGLRDMQNDLGVLSLVIRVMLGLIRYDGDFYRY